MHTSGYDNVSVQGVFSFETEYTNITYLGYILNLEKNTTLSCGTAPRLEVKFNGHSPIHQSTNAILEPPRTLTLARLTRRQPRRLAMGRVRQLSPELDAN